MALSISGRKMLGEALLVVATASAGLWIFTHRPVVYSALGIRLPAPAAPASSPPPTRNDDRSAAAARTVELAAGAHGHFFADVEMNGRSISVLVDTGASMVALTYDDARRIGVLPLDRDFTLRTNTANGIARVAPVEIDRITIGDVEVRDVKGIVAEEGALSQSLLGMTFLGRLSSVGIRKGRLVLEE